MLLTNSMSTLFLHSSGTSPAMWHEVPDEAFPGARLAPANVGYPPGPPLPRGTTHTVSDELAALTPQLARLPHEPLHIVAHSYGGLVALELALREPTRVASLYLFEPVLFGPLVALEAGRITRRADLPHTGAESDVIFEAGVQEALAISARMPWFFDDARGGTEPWLEAFIDYWNRPGSWSRLPAAQRAFLRAVGWKIYQEVRAGFSVSRAFAGLALTCPLTVAFGERTTAASRAMVHGLRAANPHATSVEVAGTGHMGPVTHLEALLPSLREHFDRARPAQM